MKLSEKGEGLLIHFEGEVLHVYTDAAGKKTVGVGHLLTADELEAGAYASGLTREQSRALLHADVAKAEFAVNTLVKVPLTEPQFDALCSWTFNLGNGALASSTLLQKLNAGDYGAVPLEMVRWDKRRDPRTGQLVEDLGLLKRRQAEANVWANGYDHSETRRAVADAVALQFDLGTLVGDGGEERAS